MMLASSQRELWKGVEARALSDRKKEWLPGCCGAGRAGDWSAAAITNGTTDSKRGSEPAKKEPVICPGDKPASVPVTQPAATADKLKKGARPASIIRPSLTLFAILTR